MQVLTAWLVLLLAWETAYRLVDWKPWVFPAPTHILDAGITMLGYRTAFGEPVGPGWPLVTPGEDAAASSSKTRVVGVLESPLATALAVSGTRLAIGFSASLALGVLLGVALWRMSFMNAMLGPVCLGMQTLPSVCWVPLAILTFGINDRGVLFVLIMGSAFSMAIATRDGLRALPPIYRAAGRMLGARGVRLYTSVMLPASLPALAGTLRQGFSFSWRSLLGAELILITQHRGLGFLLNMGRDFSDIGQVFAVMTIMVAVGIAMDRWIFAVVEQKVRIRFGLLSR